MPDSNYTSDVRSLTPTSPIRLLPVVDAPRPPLWVWLAIFAIGFTLLNLLFLPVLMAAVPPRGPGRVMPSPIVIYLTYFSLGAIGAELGLLAIAAVLGPGTAWRRHLVVALLLLVLVLSGVAGILLTERIHSIGFFGAQMNWPFTLLVPILFYVCQLPLWFFRSLFCWRIARVQQGITEKAPRLSIAGILSATAVIALALGAVRLGPSLFQQIQPLAIIETHQWWLLTGGWAAAVFAISLAVLPLFTVALFRMKSPLLGMAGAAAWSALLFEAAITIYRQVIGGWPFPFSWHLLAALVAGFTVSLVAPLLIVRLYGYRLLWGKSQAH
jgi:hypothetical protein